MMQLMSPRRIVVGLVLMSAVVLGACGESGTVRYMRSGQLFKDADLKSAVMWLSQGEKVVVAEAGEKATKVRLTDGKEGYVATKGLRDLVGVLNTDDVTLRLRPSASSGAAPSGKFMKTGTVFFVKEQEQNDEGLWFHVDGRNGSYFAGWLKADVSYTDDLAMVRQGLELEKAVREKDMKKIDELAGESGPVGIAAAAALVDLGGVEAEEGDDGAPEDAPAAEGAEDDAPDAPPPPPAI